MATDEEADSAPAAAEPAGVEEDPPATTVGLDPEAHHEPVAEFDVAPKPPSKPVPKKQVAVRDTREETGEGPSALVGSAEVGGHTLARLMTFRPFMTYFCWLAHKQNPAAHRPETRVSSLRSQNPTFYWICVGGDMIVTFVAVAILVVAAAAALYKTIWL